MRNTMTIRAHTENIFAKGFGEYVRIEPSDGHNSPYIGFIKTSLGEARVSSDSPVLFDVLASGEEITEKEYLSSQPLINTF